MTVVTPPNIPVSQGPVGNFWDFVNSEFKETVDVLNNALQFELQQEVLPAGFTGNTSPSNTNAGNASGSGSESGGGSGSGNGGGVLAGVSNQTVLVIAGALALVLALRG